MEHIEVNEEHRVIGFKSVCGMSLAVMIGSALILPGPAVDITGNSAFFAIICSGFMVFPAAVTLSEIATALPVSGGTYVYLAKAFGPLMGIVAGVGLSLTMVAKGSFALQGFVAYMKPLVETEEWHNKLMGIGMLILITILNLSGAKKLKVVQKWSTLATAVILVIMTLISFKDFDADMAFATGPYKDTVKFWGDPAWLKIFEATAFVYIGYAGLTKVSALASEIKNPGKVLPRAILTSLFTMVPFFALSTLVMSGTIPQDELVDDLAPFYTLAKVSIGKGFAAVIAILCILAMVSMANVSLLAISRFPYAMSRDGLIPPFFGKVWEKTNAPYVSILMASGVMAVCVIFLPTKKLVKLGSSFKLLIFLIENLALFVFRWHMHTTETWYRPKFKVPLYPYLQFFGITGEFLMIVLMGFEGLIAVGTVFVLSLIIYLIYGRSHARFHGIFALDEKLGIGPTNVKPLTKEEVEMHHHHNICETEHDLEEEIAFHVCPEKYGIKRGDAHCSHCDKGMTPTPIGPHGGPAGSTTTPDGKNVANTTSTTAGGGQAGAAATETGEGTPEEQERLKNDTVVRNIA